MSLIYATGFDHFSNTIPGTRLNQSDTDWVVPEEYITYVARRGGQAAYISNASGTTVPVYRVIPTSPIVTYGVAFRQDNVPPYGVDHPGLRNGSTRVAWVIHSGTPAKYALVTSYGTVMTDYGFTPGVFVYIELQVTPTRVTLKLNGVERARQDGSFASINRVYLTDIPVAYGIGRPYVDDLYIRDDDTFMGPIYIDEIASKTVALSSYVAPAGSTDLIAAIATNDGDATYANAAADGATLLFSGVAPPSTKGMLQTIVARNTELSNFMVEQLSGPSGSLRSEGEHSLIQDQYRLFQVTRETWEDGTQITAGGFSGRLFGFRIGTPG